MKILVTGGNGEFCKHLVEQGKDFSFLTPTKKEADIALDIINSIKLNRIIIKLKL